MAKGVVFGGLNSGGGKSVKSAQRGETVVTASTQDIIISPIDVSKTVVKVSIYSASTAPSYSLVAAEIINPTTLRLFLPNPGANPKVAWQVIEYDNVKSLQKGNLALTATSTNQTISPVDLSKSELIISYNSLSINANDFLANGELSSPTNINFERASSTVNMYWQVIEFN